MTQPPKPPPVIRAPPASPITSCTSAASPSMAGTVISKSSRMDQCDSRISRPVSRRSRCSNAAAICSQRRLSEMMCRARRRTTISSEPPRRDHSASSTSRNAFTRRPAAAASHCWRRRLYSLSTRPRWILESMTSTTVSAGSEMAFTSRLRQSSSSAWPFTPKDEDI
jgi:hypothetical protein